MSRVRESARDESCTLRFQSVCNGNTETTVFCHSNRGSDGKGMGLKAKIGCYGCSACHDVLDGRAVRPIGLTYEAMMERFDQAVIETQGKLFAKGLPIADDHKKASNHIANHIARGGHSKIVKRRLVGEWCAEMKALIEASK